MTARSSGSRPTTAAQVARATRAVPDRGRLWLAERDGQVVGSVAIVPATPEAAQLRWFLVEPSARGVGLGRRLLGEAVAFCQERGYDRVFLWTVSALTAGLRPD